MRFRHLPVTSELDATHNFEQLQGLVTELEEGSGSANAFTNTQMAIAYRTAAKVIPSSEAEVHGGATSVEVDTVVLDPNGNITGGGYKVPVTGVYQVDGCIRLGEIGTKDVYYVAIYVGATETIVGAEQTAPEGEKPILMVAGLVKATAGETITLRAWQHNAGAKTRILEIAPYVNRLSVFRVPPEVAEVEGVAGGDLTGTYPNPTIGTEKVTEAMLATAVQEKLSDSGWQAASFENSWKNQGGEFLTAAYRKQGNTVRLRGTIASGTNEKAAFTLAAGYRPTATVIAPASSGENKAGNVHVTAAGVVEPHYTSAGALIALDAITFTVD